MYSVWKVNQKHIKKIEDINMQKILILDDGKNEVQENPISNTLTDIYEENRLEFLIEKHINTVLSTLP
jgi:hypothetical protein